MKMRFLCVRHRARLSADPSTALQVWRQSYEQGIRLEQQKRGSLAIRHAGCALETADLLLSTKPGPCLHAVVRYSHSALLLARLLRHQGAEDLVADVIDSAIQRLRELHSPSDTVETIHSACHHLAGMNASASRRRIQHADIQIRC
ncbi:MAG: hypothetical protein ACK5ME_03575 [Parahaliea sp.]